MANYAFTTGKGIPEVPANKICEMYNLCQKDPHTPIFSGVSGLTFRNCNLVNCDPPADAVVERSLRSHVSFCSHVHPDWVAKGLAVCDQKCRHLVSTDTITIDNVVVDTVSYYEDKAV